YHLSEFVCDGDVPHIARVNSERAVVRVRVDADETAGGIFVQTNAGRHFHRHRSYSSTTIVVGKCYRILNGKSVERRYGYHTVAGTTSPPELSFTLSGKCCRFVDADLRTIGGCRYCGLRVNHY